MTLTRLQEIKDKLNRNAMSPVPTCQDEIRELIAAVEAFIIQEYDREQLADQERWVE